MCQAITLAVLTVALVIGVYFTSYAPTCAYKYTLNGSTQSDICPETFNIAGLSFKTQNICSDSPCIYSGQIGGDKTNAQMVAFCHWSNYGITVMSTISASFFLIATIYTFIVWFKDPVYRFRLPLTVLSSLCGLIAIVTGGLAIADVGTNGCSNTKFQTVFNGRQSPAVHWAFAITLLVSGLGLIGAAIINAMPRESKTTPLLGGDSIVHDVVYVTAP
jgi:hypothetical protein